MSMPIQKPGRSIQTYGTPWELIRAVQVRIGDSFNWDLAASQENTKALFYFGESQDSFAQDWSKLNGWLWLNPPYANISPWAEKCWRESEKGAKICFLVPASVGSNWFADFVHEKSLVLAIRPRITFIGQEDPYPKDCIIAVYGIGKTGFETWKWQ